MSNVSDHRLEVIRAEQVRRLYSETPVPLAVSAFLAILAAYMQASAVDAVAAMIWLGLMELTLLVRALMYLSWRRAPDSVPHPVWLKRFRLGVMATGAVWGLSALLLFPAHDTVHQTSLAFVLAGVTAGGMMSLSMDLFCMLAFASLLTLPMIGRLFAGSADSGLILSTTAVLFLVFIVAVARRQHHNLMENVLLRLQADADRDRLVQRDADLAQFNERLTALIEAIPDAIFLKDGEGRWLVVNETAKRLFKAHDFPWQGKTEMELAAARPEFREIHEACLTEDERAWQAGKLTLSQESVAADDGTVHEFEVRKMPIFGDDGCRKALVVIGRDVTERRAAERELRIAAAAFEVQEGIMIAGADQVIQRVNRAFTRLTGYASEEAVGKHADMLHSGRHDQLFYRQMQDKLAAEGYWQGELWQRCRDGSVHPYWLTISTIKAIDGAVTHYIGTFSDISHFKDAEAAIHTLAYFDQLTDLPNRRLLMDRLQQALTASERRRHHGAILFIDLDNFKTLNDTRGHAVGDMLLIEAARRLTGSVRAEDTVARLGGDEFVVMLEGLSEDAAQAATYAEVVGAKILESLNQPYLLRGYEHHSSSSIGVSLFMGGQATVDDLIKHADTAMYQAKQSGRNTIRFFDPTMQAALEARIRLEHDLRQALPQQQLKLYYQMQVDERRALVGAEVLLRWEHPERGMVSPAQFIPVAEDSGMIVSIGFWVLQMACAQLKQWEQHPVGRGLQLAVNVSARQFRQADFVDQVQHVLQQTQANPAMLKLELTESMVLDNVTDTIEKMQALRALGVRFSMDDFGTGHSSLAQLKRLPLDQVKIDRSFVRDIASDPNDAAIVQTIIAMTGTLGLEVIAEGVETEMQLEFLRRNGCSQFQGYLFGHPVALAEFEKLLSSA